MLFCINYKANEKSVHVSCTCTDNKLYSVSMACCILDLLAEEIIGISLASLVVLFIIVAGVMWFIQ